MVKLNLRSLLLALSIGVVAAMSLQWLNAPLPWMIGPLFATALARMSGIEIAWPVGLLETGQLTVGATLGLYFTPAVVVALPSFLGPIALGALFSIVLGAICAWLLHMLSGVDRTTAFFAMASGGVSEMANQGERQGAKVDRIAASHSLRAIMVVSIIPFLLSLQDVHGNDTFIPSVTAVSSSGLLILMSLVVIGAFLFKFMNTPNAFVLGPLLVATVITASGINLSAIPDWMIRASQLLIGISLGARFSPDFVHTAPRYLASVACCTVFAIICCAAFSLGLSSVSDIHSATAFLATSPGGIAEMCITARNLQLGVPIVTAFHVARLIVQVVSIGPLFRLAVHTQFIR